MSSYFYITTGILGIGSYVLYKNPEIKTKCIKETILTIDTIYTKYKMIKEQCQTMYSYVSGQEGLGEHIKLPAINMIDMINKDMINKDVINKDDEIITKLELISSNRFKHQKLVHNGNNYDLFIPNGIEIDLDNLLNIIEMKNHTFNGWLSVIINVYDDDNNLIHQTGEILETMKKILLNGNILPITNKYNFFWIDYLKLNHLNIENPERINIKWKIITDEINELEFDNHLIIINNNQIHSIEI